MDQATDYAEQAHELLATARHYEAAGDLEQAIATLQSALSQAVSAQDPALQAKLLNALALLQKRAGAFAQARETLLQALAHCEDFPQETALQATLWNNLAFVEREAGNLDQARQYQQQALRVARAAGDVLAIVEALLEQAILDKDQQRLLAAKTTIDYALELLGRRRAPRLRGHIYTLRALIALLLNQLTEAQTRYTRALAAYRRAGDRENQALVLHNLGQLYDHHINTPQRYSLALSYYTRSLKINREIGAKVAEADDLGAIAALFQLFGKLELAEKLQQAALQAYRSAGFRLGERDALTDLGILAREEQRFAEARAYLLEALQLTRAMGDQRGIVDAYFHCGDLSMVMEHFEEAAADYAHAAEATESIRALLQEAEALDYFDEARLMAYDYLIRLAVSIQRQHALAFFYLERLKSRAFLQRLRLSPLLPAGDIPATLVDQEAHLLSQLRQLTSALVTAPAHEGPDLLRDYQEREARLHTLWTQMGHYDQEYVSLRSGTPLAWPEVQHLLICEQEV
jgi:tetratricopeptide (TPR) repeat protein